MKYTVIITIGRNVGNQPMTLQDWWEYKTGIMSSLDYFHAVIVQRPMLTLSGDPDQVGFWEGKSEEAATFVAFVEEKWLHHLRNHLSVDVKAHKQQSMGFIAVPGTEHLIHAEQSKTN